MNRIKRREFIGRAPASILAYSASSERTQKSLQKIETSEMPYRKPGRTGEDVSSIGLGGFHLGQSHLEEPDMIKLFHSSIDRGINFSDNSWDYNQCKSERRIGKALKGYRD